MDTNDNKKLTISQRISSRPGMGQVITAFIGLIALVIVFGLINPTFFSSRNISNLLRQIAPFILIGIGQSYVLITGNIDLSIGSIVGMSTMLSATMMTKGVNPWIAMCITIVAALAVGVCNGYLVAGFKLPPFIATLGTMTIARGIAQIANGNYNNPEAARLSGVNVVKTTVIVYTVSAFCSSIVGLTQCASAGMGAMDAGNSYEMYAVAASVIGGVSTLGGQGILLGTVVGASIWAVLQNGLQFAGAPVAIRNIVIGLIVIVSVLLDIIVRSGKSKTFKKVK